MNKRKVLQFILKHLAGLVLKKYQPRVVGITGSVGKTTAKEMVVRVLRHKFHVGYNRFNYNTEIGVPLAILGMSGGQKKWREWLRVFTKALSLLVFSRKYPEVLVLELAADSPGDIKYFCDFIPIEVAVVTSVGISHLEKFQTREKIFKEKVYLLQQAEKRAIYNSDMMAMDSSMKEKKEIKYWSKTIKAQLLSYAYDQDADFQMKTEKYFYDNNGLPEKICFEIKTPQETVAGCLKEAWGRPYGYGLLAALTVAEYFGFQAKEVCAFLEDFPPFPHHLQPLPGIRNTLILDDTYNSAPASLREALRVMEKIKVRNKVAVLGDMLELGRRSVLEHKRVGIMLVDILINQLDDIYQIKINAAQALDKSSENIVSPPATGTANKRLDLPKNRQDNSQDKRRKRQPDSVSVGDDERKEGFITGEFIFIAVGDKMKLAHSQFIAYFKKIMNGVDNRCWLDGDNKSFCVRREKRCCYSPSGEIIFQKEEENKLSFSSTADLPKQTKSCPVKQLSRHSRQKKQAINEENAPCCIIGEEFFIDIKKKGETLYRVKVGAYWLTGLRLVEEMLRRNLSPKTVILIKGSRGMKLDKLVHQLRRIKSRDKSFLET